MLRPDGVVKVLDFGLAKLAACRSRRVRTPRAAGRQHRRGHGRGHRRVHVARAGAWPGGGRADGHLVARRDALRDGRRAQPVRRRRAAATCSPRSCRTSLRPWRASSRTPRRKCSASSRRRCGRTARSGIRPCRTCCSTCKHFATISSRTHGPAARPSRQSQRSLRRSGSSRRSPAIRVRRRRVWLAVAAARDRAGAAARRVVVENGAPRRRQRPSDQRSRPAQPDATDVRSGTANRRDVVTRRAIHRVRVGSGRQLRYLGAAGRAAATRCR